jgi:nitroreductase
MPDPVSMSSSSISHLATADSHSLSDLLTVLETRRSVKPAALGEPGPNSDELRRLLTIASRVPDHGALVPWRFMLLQGEARRVASAQLAAVYAAQHPEQSPETVATLAKLSQVFTQSPLVVTVISRADPGARRPEWEQVLTVGAVCMNLLAAATAMGYASVWLTGWAAYDAKAQATLGVRVGEKVAGFIHIGTARERPPDRIRPELDELITDWSARS